MSDGGGGVPEYSGGDGYQLGYAKGCVVGYNVGYEEGRKAAYDVGLLDMLDAAVIFGEGEGGGGVVSRHADVEVTVADLGLADGEEEWICEECGGLWRGGVGRFPTDGDLGRMNR